MKKDGDAKHTNGETIAIEVGGVPRKFNIADPDLPGWIDKHALTSDSYPYDKKMKRKAYEATLEQLQIELVKLQSWQQTTGERVLVLFEGRDAAGKGGTISAVTQYLNPRTARTVALTKPTETERGQWYFQRYVAQFPTAGEFVAFDRSWYNRAGVEPVMGFCTAGEHERFLDQTPGFEQMIVDEGIRFFKFWLNIGQETQLKRFHDRRHSRLKAWKFSPIDVAGMSKWDEYTKMRDLMFQRTHTAHAPWIIVRANDKRRARIEVIRRILATIDYAGRDPEAVGKPDGRLIGEGPDFL